MEIIEEINIKNIELRLSEIVDIMFFIKFHYLH